MWRIYSNPDPHGGEIREVSEMMLSKDRSLLLRKDKRILVLFVQLNRSKFHCNIKKDVSILIEKRGICLKRSISCVLDKYREEFDQPSFPPPQLKSWFR
jgi:hypothetical protein